jgi:hypothetical protein
MPITETFSYGPAPVTSPLLPGAGCVLWLDASTLTGSSITSWPDKSGIGNNASGGSTSLVSSGVNGLTTVNNTTATSFTGSLANSSAVTFFIMFKATGNAFYPVEFTLNGGSNYFYVGGPNGNYNTFIFYYGSGGGFSQMFLMTATSDPMLISFTGNASFATGRINGSNNFSNAPGFNFNFTGYTLGAYPAQTCEVLMYNTILTSNQINTVEGYLAWKWGTQALLPAAHPYSTARPTTLQIVSNPLPKNITNTLTLPSKFTGGESFLYGAPLITSPLSIPGCILWLDGRDPNNTGTAPANNTSLTQWKDKSPSGFTLSSGGSTYNTTVLNGFPGINIGTNFMGYDPGSQQNNWQEVFAVGIYTGGSTFTTFNGFITSSVDGDGGSGGGIILVGSGSGQTTFGGGPAQFTTTPWINGVQTWTALPAAQNTFVARTAASSAVNLRGIRFGVDRSNGRAWIGYIGECICYNTALTTTQRQQVEAYLAWKYNIQSSLSINNPYQASNPTALQVVSNPIPIPLQPSISYVTKTSENTIAILPYSASASTYTTAGSNYYTVPATAGGSAVKGVYLYILGSPGYPGHSPAGGGAFVSGYYECSPGTNLIYVVGAAGYNQNVIYGGGGAQAGGFSGVFLSNAGGIVQSNAIAIGGGGGGGGYFGTGNGGGGGYPTGYAGTQGNVYGTISGGTQTAGGVGGNAGAALRGGLGGAQGGGGGWFGGGSGVAYTPDGTFPDRPAGCGGSSYIGNINGATGGIGFTSGATYEQGFTSGVVNTYAGSSSPYYTTSNAWIAFVPAVQGNPIPTALQKIVTYKS